MGLLVILSLVFLFFAVAWLAMHIRLRQEMSVAADLTKEEKPFRVISAAKEGDGYVVTWDANGMRQRLFRTSDYWMPQPGDLVIAVHTPDTVAGVRPLILEKYIGREK